MSGEKNVRLAYSTGDIVPPAPKRAKAGNAAAGLTQGIRLRLDRRASDRLVTVLTGLPGSAAQVAALARVLRAACGAGGTVKDGAVELQGDHRETVEAALRERGLKWKRSGG
jgi:translation initiation factor 1